MELIINTEALPEIKSNYEQLKIQIAEAMENYPTEYTDANINEAKEALAKLNKFTSAINSQKINVKKQWNLPVVRFYEQVDNLLSIVDEKASIIKSRIEVYNTAKKEEKRAEITTYYNSVIGELSVILPLEKIWDDRWLNVTFTMKSIEQFILDTMARVRNDLNLISELNSEFELQIKDVYLKTLNLSSALFEKTRLEEQKKKLEVYNQATQSNSHPATVATISVTFSDSRTTDNATTNGQALKGSVEAQETIELVLKFKATMQQLHALRKYLDDNQINFERMD